jgi:hypothetical protein
LMCGPWVAVLIRDHVDVYRETTKYAPRMWK